MRWGKKTALAVIAGLCCALLWAPAAHAVAPANDDFADAQTLPGPLPIAATGSNVEATPEGGEPSGGGFFDPAPAGRSVWFRWTADDSEWVTVATCGSAFHTLPDVYTGDTLLGLAKVAPWREWSRFDCAAGGDQVTFKAVAGETYRIRVDGSTSPQPPDATEGAIALEIAPTPTPANDAFSAAQPVVAESLEAGTFFRVDVPGFSWNATKEPGEPAHGGDQGGASVWYSWTAPASGEAKVVVGSAAFDTQLGDSERGLLGVYTGSSLSELISVGTPGLFPQEASLQVTAGTAYKFAVDGRFDALSGPAMGQFTFLVYLTVPAPPVEPPITVPPPDTTAPETTIAKRDVRPGKRRATLTFRSTEAGAFLCRLDGRRQANCGSPKTYANLAPGAHTFKVRAVDGAGNVDQTPATASFRIPKPLKPKG